MAMSKQDPIKKQAWDKDNMQLIGVKLHKKNDSDILEYLSTHENLAEKITKQTIIKEALREYIAAHTEDKEK